MKLILEHEGFEVVVADNGAEALERLQEYDSLQIVITDLVMPHLDGQSLIREIREQHPDLPVLAVTGACESNLRLLCAEWGGATTVLPKPFDRREFSEVVESLLG